MNDRHFEGGVSKFWIRSWWVFVFSSLSFAIYFQAANNRSNSLSELYMRLHEMQQEKILAAQERDELALQYQSESDPAWIELVLMKELGVVPDGWTKVYFKR